MTGGAALAGLTAFTIVKEIGELTLGNVELAGWSGRGAGWLERLALGIPVSAIAAIIGYCQGPALQANEHGGHQTLHAMLDHMIDRALK